jgi:opacity protein-like surface antigen
MRLAGFCGLGLLTLATSSFAADLPILRGSAGPLMGSPAYYPWGGFYVGGQGGWSANGVDFGNSSGPLLAYALRNTDIENDFRVSTWTTLSNQDTTGVGYGAFAGYNFQWDDAVFGVELNYTSTSLKVSAADSMRRVGMVTSANVEHDVTVTAAASLKITDLATVRGRAGWAAGPVMPYVTLGLAIARGDVEKSANVIDNWCDFSTPRRCALFTPSQTANKAGAFAYGFAVGGGLDYAILPNLFLRAEYEYLGFADFNDMKVYVSTFRGGAALKF